MDVVEAVEILNEMWLDHRDNALRSTMATAIRVVLDELEALQDCPTCRCGEDNNET